MLPGHSRPVRTQYRTHPTHVLIRQCNNNTYPIKTECVTAYISLQQSEGTLHPLLWRTASPENPKGWVALCKSLWLQPRALTDPFLVSRLMRNLPVGQGGNLVSREAALRWEQCTGHPGGCRVWNGMLVAKGFSKTIWKDQNEEGLGLGSN